MKEHINQNVVCGQTCFTVNSVMFLQPENNFRWT